MTRMDAPPLDDWMTATQIASRLGVSRQAVNRMMNRGEFLSLRALGDRPIYVVATYEVAELAERRAPSACGASVG